MTSSDQLRKLADEIADMPPSVLPNAPSDLRRIADELDAWVRKDEIIRISASEMADTYAECADLKKERDELKAAIRAANKMDEGDTCVFCQQELQHADNCIWTRCATPPDASAGT